MAELNDKLITYGNLSTFYDKLQEQGLGGAAIEDVSVLPDAGENKSKLVRLESDDNVYVSELKSRTSTTTNRLPDAQQIDKAYLYDFDKASAYYYKGTIEIICSDGSLTMYKWNISDTEFWATLKNAVDIVNTDDFWDINENDGWTLSATTATNLNITINEFINEWGKIIVNYPARAILATYNAPEANQIGNATFSNQGWTVIYSGEEVTYNDSSWYKWTTDETSDDVYYITNKEASEIYGNFADYWMSDAQIFYFDGSEYVETDSYSDVTDIYIPQLNAPDSEQVDNAFIELDVDSNKYYFGITTFHCTDGDLNMPSWGVDDYKYFTTISPNNIYSEEIGMVNEDYFSDGLDVDWKDMSINMSLSAAESIINSFNFNTVPVSTVKYQRTEVTEEWDWQPLTDNATNEDIDAMFESSSPVVKRVLMKLGSYINEDNEKIPYPLSILEGLVNENDETMEYDGNTYYKWVKYEEQGDGTSIPDEVGDENVIVLTTSLNLTLPFTSESPEWAYMIGSESEEAVYASPNNETYPKEALIHEDGSITYEE